MDFFILRLLSAMSSWIVLIFIGVAIGIFFALPMIWFHIGHVSKKLSRIIEILENRSGGKK